MSIAAVTLEFLENNWGMAVMGVMCLIVACISGIAGDPVLGVATFVLAIAYAWILITRIRRVRSAAMSAPRPLWQHPHVIALRNQVAAGGTVDARSLASVRVGVSLLNERAFGACKRTPSGVECLVTDGENSERLEFESEADWQAWAHDSVAWIDSPRLAAHVRQEYFSHF